VVYVEAAHSYSRFLEGVLIHWEGGGGRSSTSISVPVPVPVGGGLFGLLRAGILIVSLSFTWLWISFAVFSRCSIRDGLVARSVVMSALVRPIFSVTGSFVREGSAFFSLVLPFPLVFCFGVWAWVLLVWFFFCCMSGLCGMGLRPNLIRRVLHSLCELAWFPLQFMHRGGVVGLVFFCRVVFRTAE
jgi:hypothetical protein